MNNLCSPDLEEYQRRFVNNINYIIETNYFFKRPQIRILDSGCEKSGTQLCYLSNLTTGDVVGINNAHDFPYDYSTKHTRENVKILNMNGMDLKFSDQTFDMVVSANVIEHVRSPEKYIQECCRVLKNYGIAYFESFPIWTSARGHHIHNDMVAKYCPHEKNYRNDGSVIPDWSHLALSPIQMRELLSGKLEEKTISFIIHYIYDDEDINRYGWYCILKEFNQTFKKVSVETISQIGTQPKYRPQDCKDRYDVAGFRIVCRKKKINIKYSICFLFYLIRRKLRLIKKYKLEQIFLFDKQKR